MANSSIRLQGSYSMFMRYEYRQTSVYNQIAELDTFKARGVLAVSLLLAINVSNSAIMYIIAYLSKLALAIIAICMQSERKQ